MESGAVIFDFDGTLMDSYTEREFAHREVSKFLSHNIDKMGFKSDPKTMLDLISKIEIEMSDGREWNRNIWWKEVIKRYLGKTIKIPSSVLSDASLIYWNTIMERSTVYPGVISLLQNLKQSGFSLGLISDTDGLKGMKSTRISHSGLSEFFNAILVAGEDTQEVKPSIKPFIKISELLGFPPEKNIFIGDNPKTDVTGAKASGMKTIIIENTTIFFRNYVTLPDLVLKRENINDLEDSIIKILNLKSIE
ncbi:MAG: HAD hydrolase-like protein [Methanoregula sp.]|nr:HAD hydrolase-like protein [Methanoregula sp.]